MGGGAELHAGLAIGKQKSHFICTQEGENKSRKWGQAVSLKAYTSSSKAVTPSGSETFSNSAAGGGQAHEHEHVGHASHSDYGGLV